MVGNFYLLGEQSGPYQFLGKKPGPLCLGEPNHLEVSHENFHEGLIFDDPRKIRMFQFDELSRRNDRNDTVLFAHEFVKHAMVVTFQFGEVFSVGKVC